VDVIVKVALVVKPSDSTQDRESRNMGYWSYPVKQFAWAHFVFGGKRAYATEMNGYDLVFQEDAGPRFFKHLKRPRVFLSIDSSLSEGHLKARLERARHADLILVDHDRPEQFLPLRVPVRRLNYCVNDRLMRDYNLERDIDISFHCANSGNLERKRLRMLLGEYCQKRGLNFTSGVLHITDYARAMARSKVVVNWPRTPQNRPHRVFDAMACGACLVTGPLPDVPGDERVEGRDYIEAGRLDDIPAIAEELIKSGRWQEVGQNGKRLVAKYHTWATRAKQLRQMLDDEGLTNWQ
jgi:glycosyltransferase involved in cell wall biosynthesis